MVKLKRHVIWFVKPVAPVVAVATVNTDGPHELPSQVGGDSKSMSRSGEGWFVRAGRVWATLTIASLATVVLGSETLSAWFIYDRDLLKQGQWWRSWTGHLVHFGRSHLFWDLVVLLPAGCWLESTWPKFTRWFYLGCPLTISAILYVFEPALLRYGGLSGLATGVLVLLAGLQLRLGAFRPTSLWWGVLGLVGFKIGNEMIVGAPLLVSDLSGSVRSVPLAHLGGAACGILGCVGVCLTPSRIVGPK